ncbi:MAG: hypothetical protein AAGH45_09730, partial [Pseudomonadota bacterium]
MEKAGIIKKIVAGGLGRKTRLHTEQNELISLRRALIDLPGNMMSKTASLLGRPRAAMPWWPTVVIPEIEEILNRSSRVVEFGTGSSTIWLAERSKFVLGIEDNKEWANATKIRLEKLGHTNAQIVFAKNSNYYQLSKKYGNFDLAIVDGSYRWKCVEL